MSFLIQALPSSQFSNLFQLPDDELLRRGAILRTADKRPGFPCRVSLIDAHIGERVLLVNYEHQPAPTPFRSCHAVYVRENAVEARCEPGEVPDLFRSRLMSIRAFDGSGMLLDADVTEGRVLEPSIERLLASETVEYVHLHYAKPGCYAARVIRI